MAHDGITDIPSTGTWLLEKGERVVDSKTNKDLKSYLNNGGGKPPINLTVNINNSDEQGVRKALPELQKIIEETVSANIASNGSIRSAIQTYG